MKQLLKIWRTPESAFGKSKLNSSDLDEETVQAVEAYSDDILANIAANGFNAIWVHGLLHHIVSSKIFPEFGTNEATHIDALNRLVKRAANHGIKVYLYMQPPRALFANDPFWQPHQDVAGHITKGYKDDESNETELISLCTSTDKVKRYLEEAPSRLAELLPDLGGIILITASEYPSHCWGRGGLMFDEFGNIKKMPIACPRCENRNPVDVVSELIAQIRNGIRKQSAEMDIIAWNWSWTAYDPAPCNNIIDKLPKDVVLMAGFERGGKKTVPGNKEIVIDEYSISYAGPSEQFKGSAKAAENGGLKMMAKLQFGTTHELATVPNLPLIGNLFDKASYIRDHNIYGFMGCWNFGNMLTANTAAFNYFLELSKEIPKEQALIQFAESYFPNCDSKGVINAWKCFENAMDNYPFSIPFLYASPINYALAYITKPEPLSAKPIGRSWLLDERGDGLEESLQAFKLEDVINAFEALIPIWYDGVELLKQSLESSKSTHAKEELNTAIVCLHTFKSTLNLYKAYQLRLNWSEEKNPQYHDIINDEITHLQDVLPILKQDSRMGYHIEAHGYMFNAEMVEQKISTLKKQLYKV